MNTSAKKTYINRDVHVGQIYVSSVAGTLSHAKLMAVTEWKRYNSN